MLRHEIFTRRGRQLLCCALVAFASIGSSARLHAQDDASAVRAAVQQLEVAVAFAREGRAQDAHATLAGLDGLVGRLRQDSVRQRQAALLEQDRCLARVRTLDVKLAELFNQETAATARVGELDAALARAGADQQLSQAEIASLSGQIAQAEAGLRERQRRLEELARWWWVPGYGQYLSIRTLVDDDVGKQRSLIGTLHDKQQRLQRRQEALSAAQATMCAVTEERADLRASMGALRCMRETVRARSSELRQMTVFLQDRESFWQRVEALAAISVDGQLKNLETIYRVLSQTRDSVAFTRQEIDTQTTSMQALLFALADSLDAGTNILLQNRTDYCLLDVPGSACAAPAARFAGAVPGSSFQRTCKEATVSGGTLTALCTKRDGAQARTSVQLRGLANMDGALVFDRGSAASSFQHTCQSSFICGATLHSRCFRRNGALAETAIDVVGIHNMDGQLTY